MISGVGFNRCFLYALDSQGRAVPRGPLSTNPAMGVQVVGARALTIQPAEARTLSHNGDDRNLGTVTLPPDEPVRGELRTAGTNLDLDAWLQGLPGANITLVPFLTIAPLATDRQGQERQVWVMAQRSAMVTDYNDLAYGQARYYTLIFRAMIHPRGSPWEYGGTDENTYVIVAQGSRILPWGEAIPVSDGYRDATFFRVVSERPLRLAVAVGDNTNTSFPLPEGHRPARGASYVRVYVNGVASPDWTLSVDRTTVNFTTAPAAGALIHILYEIE
ncbi:MAG: hypothetical protein RML46_06655 [Anaerolineae bacterium]|nr:hypothetical protein [Anaerolineae bacterium]